ncbi:hypothetical protein MRX96_050672 [Rhipicephalus microplus]
MRLHHTNPEHGEQKQPHSAQLPRLEVNAAPASPHSSGQRVVGRAMQARCGSRASPFFMVLLRCCSRERCRDDVNEDEVDAPISAPLLFSPS